MIELKPYDFSADIWSLGCTVLEMASGERPFHKANQMQALFRMVNDCHPPLPSAEKGALSDVLTGLLLQCWRREPGERPTAEELLEHPFLAADGSEASK